MRKNGATPLREDGSEARGYFTMGISNCGLASGSPSQPGMVTVILAVPTFALLGTRTGPSNSQYQQRLSNGTVVVRPLPWPGQ